MVATKPNTANGTYIWYNLLDPLPDPKSSAIIAAYKWKLADKINK